jgi:hypothetical protein
MKLTFRLESSLNVTSVWSGVFLKCDVHLFRNDLTTKSTINKDVKKYITFGDWGHAVAQLVEVLRYKPEGRCFDSR